MERQPSQASALEGLMLLGRTREEAEAEIYENQRKIWQESEYDFWDLDHSGVLGKRDRLR